MRTLTIDAATVTDHALVLHYEPDTEHQVDRTVIPLRTIAFSQELNDGTVLLHLTTGVELTVRLSDEATAEQNTAVLAFGIALADRLADHPS